MIKTGTVNRIIDNTLLDLNKTELVVLYTLTLFTDEKFKLKEVSKFINKEIKMIPPIDEKQLWWVIDNLFDVEIRYRNSNGVGGLNIRPLEGWINEKEGKVSVSSFVWKNVRDIYRVFKRVK